MLLLDGDNGFDGTLTKFDDFDENNGNGGDGGGGGSDEEIGVNGRDMNREMGKIIVNLRKILASFI